MGNFSAILAALFCATAPVASIDVVSKAVEQVRSNYQLGKDTVSSVRNLYEKGEYNEFLKEMDVSYEKAKEENGLEGLIQMRQKDVPLEFQEKWEKRFSDLQKKKNEELLNALEENDDSIFAQKVRFVASNPSTPEQEKAISKLNSFISKAPQTGANDDENTLIDLDVEYEYKLLNAQMPLSDVSPTKMAEYQLALRMEKMDKMVEASKQFQDANLKQAVGLAAANLDERMARHIDGVDLNTLAKGRVNPSNAMEEKVLSTIVSYQGQFSDLMKDIQAENH